MNLEQVEEIVVRGDLGLEYQNRKACLKCAKRILYSLIEIQIVFR